jgi:hypothetical protein
VHPDGVAARLAAEAQAGDPAPPMPADREARMDLTAEPGEDLSRTMARLADREARLNVAARVLAQEIRAARGLLPDPGAAVELAWEGRDPPG